MNCEKYKSTTHPCEHIRSHATFQTDTCKTDGDVCLQLDEQTDRQTLFCNIDYSVANPLGIPGSLMDITDYVS